MLLDNLSAIVAALPAPLQERNGLYSFETTLAERKVFLSTKKLTYRAVFRIDEAAREVRFSEMLKENAAGLSADSGFGFKAETYRTGTGGRQGGIAEQSALFGKQYQYRFDYSEIRRRFEAAAASAGYGFHYAITPGASRA
jgi:hypothetical protein